eukprot:2242920-Rhodomonas_salina.1
MVLSLLFVYHVNAQTPVQIVGSYESTCARFDDGRVKCWGNNAMGNLGLGDTDNRGDNTGEMGNALPFVELGAGRTAVQISCSIMDGILDHGFCCVILDDATIKCWGENANGQLGLGDSSNRGDGQNEMGDNLPAVNLGSGRTAVVVSCGFRHACAVLDDASV